MDIVAFRQGFPEFSDTTCFPSSQINFQSTIATELMNQCAWRDQTMLNYAIQLYVAHTLTLASQNQKIVAAGGTPGTFGGIANSKTVGGVSVGYDSASTSEQGAGWYNLTNYGKQLYHLIKLFGAGAIQL